MVSIVSHLGSLYVYVGEASKATEPPHPDTHLPVLAGWESFTGWYWFATEMEDEGTCFGFVQGMHDELGYFNSNELDSIDMVWKIKDIDLPYAGRQGVA